MGKVVEDLLTILYGSDRISEISCRIRSLLKSFPTVSTTQRKKFNQTDVLLITYGDSLIKTGAAPLRVLNAFADRYLTGLFTAIHILPFFPYSSDDGFAVVDYLAVNPELGQWDDIVAISKNFELAADLVINHISSRSRWFEKYLAGEAPFDQLAIEVDPDTDLSQVVRPRALPLLTPFTKASGRCVHLWTTFSADQIDLNFRSPAILEQMLRVVLFYIRRGISIIRLDAVAYLWKQIGTPCIHLPQTHALIKLMRRILDEVGPEVVLLTETNVPHEENISYFGDGSDEAQLVYNFSLPPLLLHAFMREDTFYLTRWAQGLSVPQGNCTYLNFSASHDGIGVRPLEGILPPGEIEALIEYVHDHGGGVSYRQNIDGSKIPYELNIAYVDAICGSHIRNPLCAAKFLASQSVVLCLPGVPAVYIHSLLGTLNWHEGVQKTGQMRAINRPKLNVERIENQLSNRNSRQHSIFFPYIRLIKIRREESCFHPDAAFEVFNLNRRVFAIERRQGCQRLLAVTNISSRPVAVELCDVFSPPEVKRLTDVVDKRPLTDRVLMINPYQVCWLKLDHSR